mmetsp:Transcript_6264/g.9212  ORF Transcript_6264/g.9212 Transcript_6264/m.9212 type:complete len:125 (-) Transcript_6264:45-419(-)
MPPLSEHTHLPSTVLPRKKEVKFSTALTSYLVFRFYDTGSFAFVAFSCAVVIIFFMQLFTKTTSRYLHCICQSAIFWFGNVAGDVNAPFISRYFLRFLGVGVRGGSSLSVFDGSNGAHHASRCC